MKLGITNEGKKTIILKALDTDEFSKVSNVVRPEHDANRFPLLSMVENIDGELVR